PMDPDELEEVLENIAARMGDEDPEWFINDYEWTIEMELGDVHEMDSISEWNERCNEADGLEEWEAEEIAAAIEAYGYSFAEALDRQQRGYFTFYPGQDLEDVAEEIINECYDLPEFALRYFDYEAFARDLGFDGYTETKFGVICDN
ncbi:MAG: antirestriction protein ArdA, partial [Oscillospiraceae bacterium]